MHTTWEPSAFVSSSKALEIVLVAACSFVDVMDDLSAGFWVWVSTNPQIHCNTISARVSRQTKLSLSLKGTRLAVARRIGASGVVSHRYPSTAALLSAGFGSTAGAALTAHPGVDKITFTGSTGTALHHVRLF